MKKLKIFVWYVGLISLLFVWNACNEEMQNEETISEEMVLEEEELVATRAHTSDYEDCGIDWWNDQEGTLNVGLIGSVIEYPEFPRGQFITCADIIPNMPYFIFYWHSSFSSSGYGWDNYQGIQIQYRKEKKLGQDEKWVNVGSAFNSDYAMYPIPKLGVIPIKGPSCCSETYVPAFFFPYGNIDIRYRLLHKDWPKPQNIGNFPPYESYDSYEASEIRKTATPWVYFFDRDWDFRYNSRGFNHYGFDSPTAWDDESNFIKLYVEVSPPNGYDQIDIEVYSMYDALCERGEDGTYKVFKGWNEYGTITVRVNVSKSFSLGSLETATKRVTYYNSDRYAAVSFDYTDFPHPL